MDSPAHKAGLAYEKIVRERAILLWMHAMLGIALGLVYLLGEPLGLRGYWNRRFFGINVLLRVSLAVWPYAASALKTSQVMPRRRGTAIFATLLLLSTSLLTAIYLSSLGVERNYLLIFGLSTMEAGLLLGSAQFLFPD